jgi:hypothetical protein
MYIISITSLPTSQDELDLGVLDAVMAEVVETTAFVDSPDVHVDPGGGGALVGFAVDAQAEYPESVAGRVIAAITAELAPADLDVQLFMTLPTGEPCLTCGGIGGNHDVSKHQIGQLAAEGIVEVRPERA